MKTSLTLRVCLAFVLRHLIVDAGGRVLLDVNPLGERYPLPPAVAAPSRVAMLA